MKAAFEVRAELLEFVHRDLVGPASGEEEILEDQPKIRYGAGVLFPQASVRNESEAAGGIEGDDSSLDAEVSVGSDELVVLEDQVHLPEERGQVAADSEHDETVTLANSYRPSAMGVSFLAEPPKGGLVVKIRAAIYEPLRDQTQDGKRVRTTWKRRPLAIEPVHLHFSEMPGVADIELAGGLRLRAVPRPLKDNRFLVTVSVYNNTVEHQRNAQTFFQVGFDIESADGGAMFVEYSALENLPEDDEELELAMLYRKRRVFAVGHGCAADWAESEADRTTRVSTEILPSVVVPPIVALSGSEKYLNMQFLAGGCANPMREIPEVLGELCSRYEAWIVARSKEAAAIEPRFRNAAKLHLELCGVALERMRAGIELLAEDKKSLEAFMLVNRVMLMQQHHSRLRRKLDEPWVPLPRVEDYTARWNSGLGYWRAFQIAFILMVLPGIVSGESKVTVRGEKVAARDLVDLIWFPTGGGKTEAYLGVTAFAIFLSRLHKPERTGCRVLMRYTLRLLTSQQFQRAASLICACEILRRGAPEKFGRTPISIGLWVGMSLTPNDEKDALRKLTQLERKKGEAKNPFQLLSCPWCGTELNNPKRLGYVEYKGRQVFLCSSGSPGNVRCPFAEYGGALPVCVVDDTIYEQPPTMLIGTVDKFAMLAWRERAGRIFEAGGGPDLIIQDELHLISGPLGSLVGLYESAIDFLCSRHGRRPKIIASTATIRRAEAQCRALYNRPTFQFPPPGLDASDSFFAVEDRTSPGRIYVGFLPTASSSPLTAQIRSVVALLQGVVLAAGDAPEEALDPYWTLVQYFGSLKELGRAVTFITADIPEFLPTMHRRYNVAPSRKRWMRTAEELTSRKNEDEIPKVLKRLETRYRATADWEEQALDTVLATNMISVGVDVQRLGLMMVVTQPKGTSEYIQASSRVGRSNRGPGLVFTLYNAGRPRDRSHYEQFCGYHRAFYRFVEPTSVTPFAPPAMERALHALLVIAGRHIADWKRPSDIDVEDTRFLEFIDYLAERVRLVDSDHLHEFQDLVRERLNQWESRRPERWSDLGGSKDERNLMRVAGKVATEDDSESWETPMSMRNVDVECSADVIPKYPVPRVRQ
jgi:hypothetical protein